jgi:hypothetical protein
MGKQNPSNVFIDLTDPAYAHYGDQAIAFADSDNVSPGYRWISVLFEDKGPVSRQDGTKLYCGTLNLQVSNDAEGTFTINFVPGMETTTLRTVLGYPIEPLDIEPLVLEVSKEARLVWIRSSEPADGSIDARGYAIKEHERNGWTEIELTMSGEVSALTADDFVISDGTGKPPRVKKIERAGRKAKLAFDRPITRKAMTRITHKASGSSACIGCFPGDVNNDRVTDWEDIKLLIDGFNGDKNLPPYRMDLDGNGVSTAADVLELVRFINEG